MQKTTIKQKIIFIMTRVWVLCAIALLIFYKGTDLYLMKVKAINHVVPQSMESHTRLITDPKSATSKELSEAINYYKTIVKMVPNSWADWEFLGYAYFFKGDIVRAKKCFLRAYEQEKGFFWYSYNLGIVYFHEGQFDLAKNAFNNALSASFGRTIELMHAYKAYNMIMPYMKKKGYKIETSINEALLNAQALRLMCDYRLSGQKDNPRFFPRLF